MWVMRSNQSIRNRERQIPVKALRFFRICFAILKLRGQIVFCRRTSPYFPMEHGFVYLTAVTDWYSRYILSWRQSNTLKKSFCIEVLEDALSTGRKPKIFNTDQGSQYTSVNYTDVFKRKVIRISTNGRGRALDNIFIERFWRTVKYVEVYLNHYNRIWELEDHLAQCLDFYCFRHHHGSLGYRASCSSLLWLRREPAVKAKSIFRKFYLRANCPIADGRCLDYNSLRERRGIVSDVVKTEIYLLYIGGNGITSVILRPHEGHSIRPIPSTI